MLLQSYRIDKSSAANIKQGMCHVETRLPAHVLENRQLLAEMMGRAGSWPLATEWWHYDDADSGGDILDVPFGELCR